MPYREEDWLCSRCGQVSNNSEPCYACDRKEREAHPIPPPPPAPDLPIAYRGWKQKTKRGDRQPSNTPYTVGWPRPKPNKMRMYNMPQSPPERTPRKRGPRESREGYDIYLAEFREEQQPKVVYLDHLYTQDEIDEMEYNAIHRRVFRLALWFIDWLNRLAGVEKSKNKTNGEKMLSIEELFEEHKIEAQPPPPAPDRPTRDATRRY